MVIHPLEIDRAALNSALLKIAIVLAVIFGIIHLISRVYLWDKYLKEQVKKADRDIPEQSTQEDDN